MNDWVAWFSIHLLHACYVLFYNWNCRANYNNGNNAICRTAMLSEVTEHVSRVPIIIFREDILDGKPLVRASESKLCGSRGETWNHIVYSSRWSEPLRAESVGKLICMQPNHGGPSEAGDCSHPPPKMATAENPTSGKGTFDNVMGRGSLRFLACEKVLDISNLSHNNDQSPRARTASGSTRIFGERQVTRPKEAGDWTNKHIWEAGDFIISCIVFVRFNYCKHMYAVFDTSYRIYNTMRLESEMV